MPGKSKGKVPKEVRKSIRDEGKASSHYPRLARQLGKSGYRKEARQVRVIGRQEARHKQALTRISRNIEARNR